MAPPSGVWATRGGTYEAPCGGIQLGGPTMRYRQIDCNRCVPGSDDKTGQRCDPTRLHAIGGGGAHQKCSPRTWTSKYAARESAIMKLKCSFSGPGRDPFLKTHVLSTRSEGIFLTLNLCLAKKTLTGVPIYEQYVTSKLCRAPRRAFETL